MARRLFRSLAFLASGCQGILGIPSEGELGCPAPCELTVSGRVVRAESSASPPLPLAGVTVRLRSVDPPQTVTSGPNGEYSFTGLAMGTPLELELSFAQTDPDTEGLLDTRYVAGALADQDVVLDLPVVQYRWLARVAFECGIFPTLEDALFEPGTMMVNSYFITRSTVIGEVLEENGDPASLDRLDVGIRLDGHDNYDHNPMDTENPPGAVVCFLEPDPESGEYRGVNDARSTEGRFVMFRVRNTVGTGTGTGEVRIPGYPPGPLDLASGSVGFSHIELGDGVPLPPRALTFERDVYRYFSAKFCSTTCHRPGGIGFTEAPEREGPGGILYPADWSGTPEQVFDALTKPFDTNCSAGGTTAARVCKAKPDASLLYVLPAGLGEHPGTDLGIDDEMVVAILQWIEDGALLR